LPLKLSIRRGGQKGRRERPDLTRRGGGKGKKTIPFLYPKGTHALHISVERGERKGKIPYHVYMVRTREGKKATCIIREKKGRLDTFFSFITQKRKGEKKKGGGRR